MGRDPRSVPPTNATPSPPAWGVRIREHREHQGRSIRQVASVSGLSDSYWGQVERGYQTTPDGQRVITPSRATLVLIADALRLSAKETNELLALADEPPVQSGDSRPARGEDVDLRGLSRRDIALLNAIADRFRAAAPLAEADEPAPLRAVARGAKDPARSGRRATQLARDERKKQTRG